MRHSLERIPSGEAGTDQTVRRLSNLVQESLEKGRLRLLALNILKAHHVRDRDCLAAARAIYKFVQGKIRYIPDPIGLETIQQPDITLWLKAGDCDDHAALVGALAHCVGIPARFRVVGDSPDNFSHIFPELLVNGQWYPADTTNPDGFGKRPGQFAVEKVYSVNGGRAMPRLGAPTPTVPIPRRLLARAAYDGARRVLIRNWNAGLINRKDLVSYISVIDQGNSPGRGTFADPAMRQAVSDFIAKVDATGAVSAKSSGQMNGLEGLDGFLKSVWGGVKKAVRASIGSVARSGIPVFSQAAGIAEGVLFKGGAAPPGDPNEGYQYGHSASAWVSLNESQKNKVRSMEWTGRPDVPQWLSAYRSVVDAQGPRSAQKVAYQVMISGGQLPRAASPAVVLKPNIQAQVSPEAARAGVTEFIGSPGFLIPVGLLAAFILLRK